MHVLLINLNNDLVKTVEEVSGSVEYYERRPRKIDSSPEGSSIIWMRDRLAPHNRLKSKVVYGARGRPNGPFTVVEPQSNY